MGLTQSSHTADEKTAFFHRTPFFVYMDPLELRDFSRCFVVKNISKDHNISSPSEMYIVAKGEICMTTLLDDELDVVPKVSRPVNLHAGDASSGRTMREVAGAYEDPPVNDPNQFIVGKDKKKGK